MGREVELKRRRGKVSRTVPAIFRMSVEKLRDVVAAGKLGGL